MEFRISKIHKESIRKFFRRVMYCSNFWKRIIACFMALILFQTCILEAYAGYILSGATLEADDTTVYADDLRDELILTYTITNKDTDKDYSVLEGQAFDSAGLMMRVTAPDSYNYYLDSTNSSVSTVFEKDKIIYTIRINIPSTFSEVGNYKLEVQPADVTAGPEFIFPADGEELVKTIAIPCEPPVVTFNYDDFTIGETPNYSVIYNGTDITESGKSTSAPYYYQIWYMPTYISDPDAKTTSLPTVKGIYEVTIKVFANGVEAPRATDIQTVEVFAKVGSGTITVADVPYGTSITPVANSTTNGTLDVYYRYKRSEDTTYSDYYEAYDPLTWLPGTYDFQAIFPETEEYQEVIADTTFKVLSKEGDADFTIADINYGETINPVVTSLTNDVATKVIEYKLASETDESKYSTLEPKDAGVYDARLTLDAKDLYGTVVKNTTFSILPIAGSGSITVDVATDRTFTIEPISATNGIDHVTYEYKKQGATDSTYTSAKPTVAGKYTVRATFAATQNYKEVVAETDFEIGREEGIGSITIADIEYGKGTVSPEIASTTNGTASVTIEYKKQGAADSTYTTTKPTAVGKYTARATFAATEEYTEAVATTNFEIRQGTGIGSITIADIEYGKGTVSPEIASTTNGTASVTIEYKKQGSADSTYITTKPTAVGKYTARATFAATEEYTEAVATTNFEIKQGTGIGSITVADIVYGKGVVSPEVSSVTNGTTSVTIEYKKQGSADSTYTSTKPTAVGKYTARATFAETEEYTEAVATTNFEISELVKKAGSGSITVADIVYGKGVVTPEVTSTTNGTASVIIEYKKQGSADSTYTTTKPTEVGKYVARATFAATEEYTEAVAITIFEIKQGAGIGSITVADIVYGKGVVSPEVSSVTNGTTSVTIEYKKQGSADSTYTTTKPTAVGKYTARAIFAATEEYTEAVATASFSITENEIEKPTEAPTEKPEIKVKKEGKASISVADVRYGEGSISAVVASITNGRDNVKVMYKESGASDKAYTTEVPTEPGKYTAIAIFAENSNYKEVSATTDFEIKKGRGNVKLDVADVYYGVKVNATDTTTMKKASTAIYEYKVKGTADDTYTTVVPNKVGEYTVRVTYPENKYYTSISQTKDFMISYMPTPIFSFEGQKGENGYYNSDIMIVPPKGYLVSKEANGDFVESLTISEKEQFDYVYFKNIKTGARTARVELGEYLLDATKPQYNGAPVQDNVYADTISFDLQDENLQSVTVNGEEAEIIDGKVNFDFSADGGYKKFAILARDKAGNESELNFTLSSPWLRNKVIPAGQEIRLETLTEYYLEQKSDWKMNGDSTVYAGGNHFYIKQDGKYTFETR